MTLTLRSPSKINLHLRVAGPKPDGYHPLRSWMITTSLCDELTFTESRLRRLTCDDRGLACDGSNLVWRAAEALLADGGMSLDVAIHLAKRIPAGAGLGGGSGNAATTLVGINRLLNLDVKSEELHAIAATLGSDVPFFLGPPSAIASGRGEHLEATPAPVRARFAVLILPAFAVSTAAAYRTFDELLPRPADEVLAPFDAAGWSALRATELLPHLVNDLEASAFALEPRLAALRIDLEKKLGRVVRMSGSGSTLFSLFDDKSEASSAAHVVTENFAIRTSFVELGKPSGFFD